MRKPHPVPEMSWHEAYTYAQFFIRLNGGRRRVFKSPVVGWTWEKVR